MNHRKNMRKLNRTSTHRKAMFKNMANSLFKHGIIKTTLPKAKELRRVAEKLITLAKDDSVHTRRLAFAKLRDDAVVADLFTNIAPASKDRNGGYTRILKCGNRVSDNAPMAFIELVDHEH